MTRLSAKVPESVIAPEADQRSAGRSTSIISACDGVAEAEPGAMATRASTSRAIAANTVVLLISLTPSSARPGYGSGTNSFKNDLADGVSRRVQPPMTPAIVNESPRKTGAPLSPGATPDF